jgi:hypothetical protein
LSHVQPHRPHPFDSRLHGATPGLFEIQLHAYADGRFASETAIAEVDGAMAVETQALAVRRLLDKGHQAHVSELRDASRVQLSAA